jgi:hypothetical protein
MDALSRQFIQYAERSGPFAQITATEAAKPLAYWESMKSVEDAQVLAVSVVFDVMTITNFIQISDSM